MVGYPFSNNMKDCFWKAKRVCVKSLRHRTLTGSEIAAEISNSIFLSFFFSFLKLPRVEKIRIVCEEN